MAKTPGAMWISGTDLHFVDSTGNEWSCTGTVVNATAPTGSTVGEIQISSTNNSIVYVDTANAVRTVPNTLAGAVNGIHGATWIDTFLRWVDSQGNARYLHSDVAHADHTDNVTYSNSHSDTAYANYTDNVPYSNGHSDIAYSNGHSDTAYSNAHTDDYTHNWGHGDHSDTAYSDVGGHYSDFLAHNDYRDTHSDTAYSNSHSDTAYSNSHSDTSGYADHADRAYANSHSDVAAHSDHADTPYSDSPVSLGV